MKPTNKPIFLFVNTGGDWLSIAQRVKAEGYPIKFYISPKVLKGSGSTGHGILDKTDFIDDFWQLIVKKKPEELIILNDDNGETGYVTDYLRSKGYKVINGGAFAAKIEHDRGFGEELAKQIGLKIPPSFEFSSLSLARAFVNQQPDEAKFVFKPSGESFAGGSKTYLGKNKQDLLQYMEWLKLDQAAKHYQIEEFVLQQFVPGKEVDFAMYFDGDKFMKDSMCITFEKKKIDNKGVAVGCLGQVLFFTQSKYLQFFKKLEPILRQNNYCGQIAINNICAEADGQMYFLEFTSRQGWDSTLGEMAIHQQANLKLADFFLALANKQDFSFNHKLVSATIRIYCGYPEMPRDEVVGRFFSYDPKIAEYIWLYSASQQDESLIVEGGAVLCTICAMPNLTQALKGIYDDYVPKINISDMFFHPDISEGVTDKVKFLKAKGWL